MVNIEKFHHTFKIPFKYSIKQKITTKSEKYYFFDILIFSGLISQILRPATVNFQAAFYLSLRHDGERLKSCMFF